MDAQTSQIIFAFHLHFFSLTPNFHSSKLSPVMTPEEFLSILDNPNLISGIHNYCDRWCERCSMTSRCSVFLTMKAQDEEDPLTEERGDEQIWKKVRDSFQLTFQLIESHAKKNGIKFEMSEEEADSFQAERQSARKSVEQKPAIILAHQYIDFGKKWLDSSQTILQEKEAELNQAHQLGLPSREHEASDIKDCLDVIAYYLFQICVKMMRAYSGRQKDDKWFEENDFPKDSDGSAKVALIGIDNSMNAWSRMLFHFQEEDKSILEVLAVLQKLLSLIEEDFPAARGFVRPGFDD